MTGRELVTFGGIRRPLQVWCEIVNLPLEVVVKRLEDGMSVNEALTTPERTQGGWQQRSPKAYRSKED